MIGFISREGLEINGLMPTNAEAAVIFWIFLVLLPFVMILKARTTEPRVTPDGNFYIALACGAQAPAPYCYRVLLPFLARVGAKVTERQPREALACLGRLGSVGAVVATYALTWTLSGSHPRALVSAYAITFADSFFRYSLGSPWLIDSASCSLALTSVVFALNGYAVIAVALLALTALAKEVWSVLSWAFIASADPMSWWMILPALLIYAGARLVVKPAVPDPKRTPWLVSPIRWAWANKRHKWFDWRTNIGRLGPTPWLLAFYAGHCPLALPVVVVVVLSWAQAHIAADHDRLLANMLPFVIPVICITAPTDVLMVYVVASCYWPFYRNE